MTDLQRLEAIYKHIRDNGVLRGRPAGTLGGIWSADIYDLDHNSAFLCDDGSTLSVSNGWFRAWSSYGRAVEYGLSSDVSGLIEMYDEIFA